MAVRFECECGRQLQAPTLFAGSRAECPYCGKEIAIPEAAPGNEEPADEQTAQEDEVQFIGFSEEPMDVVEFFDPPSKSDEQQVGNERPHWSVRMAAAMLDPRSIQWMLVLGGVLMVLGLIIWLTSLGVFENAWVVAGMLTVGSLTLHLFGCLAVIKGKYKVAGRALAFLACILIPLNLWYFHAQGLITIENHLWIGAMLCCLLYATTVVVLRDPLFMYAVEGGVTLTGVLLLANLGFAGDASYLCSFLVAMALISIHAERAFEPDAEPFSRRRFGLPLFWCGHAQLGVALLLLLWTQSLGWLADHTIHLFDGWNGNWLMPSQWLGGTIWLAGMYLYLYSDFVVRRVGVYLYLAATCLFLAVISLVGLNLMIEALIFVLAVASLIVNYGYSRTQTQGQRFSAAFLPLGMILALPPILLGIQLHVRASSDIAEALNWDYETGQIFVVTMVIVALCNRASAFIFRHNKVALSWNYMFLSAAAVIVALAGLLREVGITVWAAQAPILMLLPIAYIVAARMWRGHSPEKPLGAVAHAATVTILLHVLFSALASVDEYFAPLTGNKSNLLLGLVFGEATVFYIFAAVIRSKSLNVYFAAIAACGAIWQLMCWQEVPGPYYAPLFAGLGFGLLVVSRQLGVELVERFLASGTKIMAVHGRGRAAFQSGSIIASIAFVALILQRLTQFLRATDQDVQWLVAISMTTAIAFASYWISPACGWRRWFGVCSVALAGLALLTFHGLLDMPLWRKLEIASTGVGIVVLIASYVGRFMEEEREDDTVTLGLWMGSILSVAGLLAVVLYHRFVSFQPSLGDELALLTVAIFMLVTGYSWQVKITTLIGGASTTFYLAMFILMGAYNLQMAVGVYLAIGGGLLFGAGVILSVYREHLLALPDRMARREGLFRVLNWR